MAADPYIGQDIIGQFRIVERIGKGGMGAVYKAEQPAMGRYVAVKILHRNLTARRDIVSRFRREARAMSRLTHPNTVRVFLYGQLDSGALYIVMEHLEGANLHQLTKREGPMVLDRALRILIQVCGALEEAHNVGIVHRDLKPENILLTEQGGMPNFPKVLDFGLAKVHDVDMKASGPLTQQGMVFGTPEFMSPEQAQGKTLDGRSDIYSLGVILYEMVTGKLPFNAKNATDYIRHHIKSPPIPVSQRVDGLRFPPGLDEMFDRVLAKNVAERCQSAAELAEHLRRLLPEDRTSQAARASAAGAHGGGGMPSHGQAAMAPHPTPAPAPAHVAAPAPAQVPAGPMPGAYQNPQSQVQQARPSSSLNYAIIAVLVLIILILAGTLTAVLLLQ